MAHNLDDGTACKEQQSYEDQSHEGERHLWRRVAVLVEAQGTPWERNMICISTVGHLDG